MTAPIRPQGVAITRAAGESQAKLRKAAHDLEGIFVQELFKAMRETVPDDGIIAQTPGQDLFTGLLDQRLAETQAARSQNGLGDALYRQLSQRLPSSDRP